MLTPGDVHVNDRTGTRFEVAEASRQRLRFRRTYGPRTGEADAHYHLDFVQEWTVVDGRCRVQIDGEDRDLAPGESLAVELGTPHKDAYNPHHEPLVVDWRIEPCNEFIEAYGDAYAHLLVRGELNEQDEFPMLQLFTILAATKGQSFASGPPRALQKVLIPVAALVGRLRGYRPRYD